MCWIRASGSFVFCVRTLRLTEGQRAHSVSPGADVNVEHQAVPWAPREEKESFLETMGQQECHQATGHFPQRQRLPKEVWGRGKVHDARPRPQDWRGRLWDAVDFALRGEGICFCRSRARSWEEPGELTGQTSLDLGGVAVRLAWELDVALPEMPHCLSCLMSLPAWLLRKVNDHLQPCIIRCGTHASIFPRTVTYTAPSRLPFPLLLSKLWVPPRGVKKGLPARPCSSAWLAQTSPLRVPASSELHGIGVA